MRTLGNEQLTTQEISDRMTDVPKSSIYRHLKLLLDGSLVVVADSRLVNGIQEKVYKLIHPPALDPGDLAQLTAEDHVRYFTTYALMLIQDFASYVNEAEAVQGYVDFITDRAGYREATFYATPLEMDVAIGAINQALLPLIQNEPGNGRKLYKLATVLHPRKDESQ